MKMADKHGTYKLRGGPGIRLKTPCWGKLSDPTYRFPMHGHSTFQNVLPPTLTAVKFPDIFQVFQTNSHSRKCSPIITNTEHLKTKTFNLLHHRNTAADIVKFTAKTDCVAEFHVIIILNLFTYITQ